MAKVVTRKQLLLTSEEKETLKKARVIFQELDEEDSGGEIFCQADNYETEWYWLVKFIENLVLNSEVEKNV